jgi:hypothetical protein
LFIYCIVGNKADLVASGGAQREVTKEEAAEYAAQENIDFVETSALTGEGVEPMFRRLVLSVAKLLPDVQLHLEVTGLPEGWISQVTSIEYTKPIQDRRLLSDEAATSSETNSDCLSDPKSDPKFDARASLRRHSSMESVDKPSLVRAKPEVKMIYINYWTGEKQDSAPLGPAPTKLIYQSVVSSKTTDVTSEGKLVGSKKDSVNLRQQSVE